LIRLIREGRKLIKDGRKERISKGRKGRRVERGVGERERERNCGCLLWADVAKIISQLKLYFLSASWSWRDGRRRSAVGQHGRIGNARPLPLQSANHLSQSPPPYSTINKYIYIYIHTYIYIYI
jgi:hypothetical protein